jgi:hypothetical protein
MLFFPTFAIFDEVFQEITSFFPYRCMVINNTANFCSKIADRIFWFEAEFVSDYFYMNTTETPLKNSKYDMHYC